MSFKNEMGFIYKELHKTVILKTYIGIYITNIYKYINSFQRILLFSMFQLSFNSIYFSCSTLLFFHQSEESIYLLSLVG